MNKYIYIIFYIFIYVNGFSQKDSSLHKTIGLNNHIIFQDYGLYFSQEISKKCAYTIQVGYPLVNSKYSYGIKGISTSTTFEYKTKNIKNYPYVSIGLYYKYKAIDSIADIDQISESYRFKSSFYSFKTGWGYNWNVNKMSISFLLGFYTGWQKTVKSNYHLIYSFDENYTVPKGIIYHERYIPCIPLLDFSIGYKF